MVSYSNNGSGWKPLIGVPMARDKSQRYYGLPVFIQNQTYLGAIAEAGGAPITIPLHLDEDTLRTIFERLDGLFLPGGEDMDPSTYGETHHELLGPVDPERDRVELLLTRWALERSRPLFAVCRGMQVLNTALGGTLYQDIRAQRGNAIQHDYFPPQYERFRISHDITVERDSLLATLFGTRAWVNSMHHQAVKTLGLGCRPTAHAADGVVEAMEVMGHPFALGVQWHPEELASQEERPMNHRLFATFVEQCRQPVWA